MRTLCPTASSSSPGRALVPGRTRGPISCRPRNTVSPDFLNIHTGPQESQLSCVGRNIDVIAQQHMQQTTGQCSNLNAGKGISLFAHEEDVKPRERRRQPAGSGVGRSSPARLVRKDRFADLNRIPGVAQRDAGSASGHAILESLSRFFAILTLLLALFLQASCGTPKAINSTEADPFAFTIRLADSPGPGGHALSDTPWALTKGERPDGLSFVDDSNRIAEGTTDPDGRITLTPDENRELHGALSRSSGDVWLLYPGQIFRLIKVDISADWDKETRLFYWLKNNDFLNHATRYEKGIFTSPEGMEELGYAMEAYGARDIEELHSYVDLPDSGSLIFFMK